MSNENSSYANEIKGLFALLAKANLADSNNKQQWQRPDDAIQNGGYYGHIRNAIKAIAGEDIIGHWVDTGDIDISLANRDGYADVTAEQLAGNIADVLLESDTAVATDDREVIGDTVRVVMPYGTIYNITVREAAE